MRTVVVGERYAYRERPRTPGYTVNQVEVLKLGPPRTKPRQVRVRFLDGEYEGMEDWVAQSSLLVPWDEAEALAADERRVALAKEASGEVEESLPWRAAEMVFCSFPMPTCNQVLVGVQAKERELLSIRDISTTAPTLGINLDDLLAEPFAFVDRFGEFKAPFQTALKLAQHCCREFPDQVLRYVKSEEDALRSAATKGYYVAPGNPSISYSMSSDQAEAELQRETPVFELVRRWCGEDAIRGFDQVGGLRVEISRLRSLVESAAKWIEDAGYPEEAEALRDDLNQVQRPRLRRAARRPPSC